jgi:hypothetical protein
MTRILDRVKCGGKRLIFLKEDKPALHYRVVTHGHLCCLVCMENAEREGLIILRPDVCSNISVNCLHFGSDNNPTVWWFVDTSIINGLAHNKYSELLDSLHGFLKESEASPQIHPQITVGDILCDGPNGSHIVERERSRRQIIVICKWCHYQASATCYQVWCHPHWCQPMPSYSSESTKRRNIL